MYVGWALLPVQRGSGKSAQPTNSSVGDYWFSLDTLKRVCGARHTSYVSVDGGLLINSVQFSQISAIALRIDSVWIKILVVHGFRV